MDWFLLYLVTGLVAGFMLFLSVLGAFATHPLLGAFVLFLSVAATTLAAYGGYRVFAWSRERRLLSVVYDVGAPALYQRAAAASGLGEALVESGLTSLTVFPDLARAPMRFRVDAWPALLTNVQLWSGHSVRRGVLFLPDQLVLRLGERVLGVPYARLSITSGWLDSAEISGIPRDAQVVAQTWLHARKDGGPDLRFRENPHVFTVRYQRLDVGLPDGTAITIVTSSRLASERAESLLRFLASPIGPTAVTPPSPAKRASAQGQESEHRAVRRRAVPARTEPTPHTGSVSASPSTRLQMDRTEVLLQVEAPPATPPEEPVLPAATPVLQAPPSPPVTAAHTTAAEWLARVAATQASASVTTRSPGPSPRLTTACRWYGPAEVVEVGSHRIPGLVYVGTHLPSRGYDQRNDAALINPRLPVEGSDGAMGYWPHYAEVAPGARARYLRWHQDGRRDPGAEIGLVFLFFYGLERRILIDLGQDDAVRVELPAITSELERLLSLYGDNGSFRSYATSLLDWIRVADGGTPRYLKPPHPDWDRFRPSLEHELALGQLARDERPLDAEWAFAWWSAWPEARVRTPALRCPDLMRELFFVRFRQKYAPGLQIPPGRARLDVTHRPASPTIARVPARVLNDVPAVFSQKSALRKLEGIADQCQDELDAYSRWLGRSTNRGGIAGVALLPPEIAPGALPEAAREYVDGVRGSLADADGVHLSGAADLVHLWTGEDSEKVSAKDASLMAEWLQRQGVGIEPDARVDPKPLSMNQTVALFAVQSEATRAPGASYASAAMLVNLASLVVMADGVAHPKELASVDGVLESWESLTPAETVRLKARFRLHVREPPKLAAVRKRVEHLDRAGRLAFGKALAGIAAADGEVSPDELKLLTKLYDALGLDPERLFSELHAADTAPRDQEPVVVQRARGAGTGHAIPPRAEHASGERPRIELDASRIARLRAETERVVEILHDVFQEEPLPVTAPSSSGEDAGGSAIDGLDGAETALVRRLAEMAEISAGDLVTLGEDCGVQYPAPVLEKVNELAYDRLNEPAFEDGDPIVINEGALMELLK